MFEEHGLLFMLGVDKYSDEFVLLCMIAAWGSEMRRNCGIKKN